MDDLLGLGGTHRAFGKPGWGWIKFLCKGCPGCCMEGELAVGGTGREGLSMAIKRLLGRAVH